jgi:hypothetical protein
LLWHFISEARVRGGQINLPLSQAKRLKRPLLRSGVYKFGFVLLSGYSLALISLQTVMGLWMIELQETGF